MSLKFSLQIDCHVQKRATSPNTKPEVVLRRRAAIVNIDKTSLPGSISKLPGHYCTADGPMLIKCGKPTQNDMTITAIRSKSKPDG